MLWLRLVATLLECTLYNTYKFESLLSTTFRITSYRKTDSPLIYYNKWCSLFSVLCNMIRNSKSNHPVDPYISTCTIPYITINILYHIIPNKHTIYLSSDCFVHYIKINTIFLLFLAFYCWLLTGENVRQHITSHFKQISNVILMYVVCLLYIHNIIIDSILLLSLKRMFLISSSDAYFVKLLLY